MTSSESASRGCAPLALALVGLAIVACGIVATLRALERARSEAPRRVERFRVQSRSMEPQFLGPRFALQCPKCGARFYLALDVAPDPAARGNAESREARDFRERARYASCAECGFDRVPTVEAVFYDGELVAAAEQDVALARWDVAVFKDASGRQALKRVVGLPCERVALRNGDLYINGAIVKRDWRQIWSTASDVGATETTRYSDRTLVSRVMRYRDDDDRTRVQQTAITNESQAPAWNGANVANVEFARDFLVDFEWFARDGALAKFAILARRPTGAWLVELDPARRAIDVASIRLYNGRATSGRTFESLTRADFAREERTRFDWHVEPQTARKNYNVKLAIVDGELILVVDGNLCARLETNDLNDPIVGIATPFVVLGDSSRVTALKLARDLHYSSVNFGAETTVPQGLFYVLGDNSPASRDSRFDDVGAVKFVRALVKRDEREFAQ